SRDSGIESPKPAVNRAKPDFSKLAEKLKSRPSNSRKPVSNTQATESNGNSKRSGFGDRKFDVLGNARRISRAINEPVNTALAVAIFSSDFKVPNAEFVRYHDKHSRRTLIETPKAKGWVECTDSTAIAREPTAQANADILAAYAADRGWQRVCTTSTDKEFLEAFVDSCIERDIKLDLTPEQDKILGWGEPELEEADRLTM
ncbi:MAG TPA: hypothetical protein VL020_07890, partial [Pseudomonadales bacterium]|nr:hypothetical protein [Pseudomonadales bacterium]